MAKRQSGKVGGKSEDCAISPPATVIIPARYGSTRFPGKVLADRTGKPLVRHVWEVARSAACVGRVVVATDDERVLGAVVGFGGEGVLTSPEHPNGTSRLAEAAESLGLGADDVVVNVQGDEPELEPALIDLVARTLIATGAPVATVASPLTNGDSADDPHLVKVVVDRRGRAMYFSRSPIPHGAPPAAAVPAHGTLGTLTGRSEHRSVAQPLKHVGLYAYRRSFLDQFVRLPPTPLELTERLEQLRVLEHGHAIAVAVGESRHRGIDTPEQYEAFVARQRGSPRS